jgi:hypothetical protein
VVFLSVSLKDEWDRLDSATRTWILENSACPVLPPAISAKLNKDAHGVMAGDPHGQVVLSREDRDFVREKAESAGRTIQVPVREYQFFDTASLPVVMKASAPGMRVAVSADESR